MNFGQLQSLPLLLGLALGLLALLTITHLLLTSVHRRRRDLAVLRALGFTGGQVRATVSWMAVTLAVALAVGIPVGLLCGRQPWRVFAGQLGISDVTQTPVLSFVLLAVAGLALAVAIASRAGHLRQPRPPGRRAAEPSRRLCGRLDQRHIPRERPEPDSVVQPARCREPARAVAGDGRPLPQIHASSPNVASLFTRSGRTAVTR